MRGEVWKGLRKWIRSLNDDDDRAKRREDRRKGIVRVGPM